MRRLAVIAMALCAIPDAGPAPVAAAGEPLPPQLARLVLAEDSDEITPVLFEHGRHAAISTCAGCHHEGSDSPVKAPGRCGSCHPLHAEEGKPPDL
jgi:hypothetical protein